MPKGPHRSKAFWRLVGTHLHIYEETDQDDEDDDFDDFDVDDDEEEELRNCGIGGG